MHAHSLEIVKSVALVAALVFSSAAVQSAAQADPIGDALSAFDQVCLKRFPASNAINAFVAQNRMEPVSEQDVRQMLGTDPGVGWSGQSPSGPYTLTIELPPYHTCAVRKRFSDQPDVRARISALLQSWTKARRGARLKAHPTERANVGGIDSRVDVFEIAIPGIRQPEDMMAIVTPVEDGGSELRLARAIGNR